METAAAVEIEQGRLWRYFLDDFHRCLKKSSQKTLRLFHSYHRPDGDSDNQKQKSFQRKKPLMVAMEIRKEHGFPQPRGQHNGSGNQRSKHETAVHLKHATFWSEEWGAPHSSLADGSSFDERERKL